MGVTREAADEAMHAPREARNCEALGDELHQRASREGGTLRYEAALDEAEAWLRAAP